MKIPDTTDPLICRWSLKALSRWWRIRNTQIKIRFSMTEKVIVATNASAYPELLRQKSITSLVSENLSKRVKSSVRMIQ